MFRIWNLAFAICRSHLGVGMKQFTVVIILSLSLSGCAAKWAPVTETSETQLLWLADERVPKMKLMSAIKGFKESGTTLAHIVRGKEESTLMRPVSVATGRDGRIAIADTGSRMVHLYIPAEERYVRINASNNEEIVSPVGVIFDDALRLYVSDSARRKIYVFDAQGQYTSEITKAGDDQLRRPAGLAYSPTTNLLYIADVLANKIYALDPGGSLRLSFGDRGTGKGQFNFPTHLYWAPPGTLYITDSMNFRIQIYDAAGIFLGGFGNHGDGSGDFSMPKGVVADRFGTIYVVDTLFDTIQLFDKQGNFLLPLGGQGTALGEFWLPTGLFVDGNKLLVCDTFNQRVQVFEIIGPLHEEQTRNLK